MGGSFQQTFVGVLGSQGKRGEGVHNQVDPQQLDWLNDLGLNYGSSDQSAENCHHVHCQLELHELPDRVVNVSSPEHSLYD